MISHSGTSSTEAQSLTSIRWQRVVAVKATLVSLGHSATKSPPHGNGSGANGFVWCVDPWRQTKFAQHFFFGDQFLFN